MIDWTLASEDEYVQIWHGYVKSNMVVSVVIDERETHAYYTWLNEASELGEGTVRITSIAGITPLEPKKALVQIYSAWIHKNNPHPPDEPFMVFRDDERGILWEVWDVK